MSVLNATSESRFQKSPPAYVSNIVVTEEKLCDTNQISQRVSDFEDGMRSRPRQALQKKAAKSHGETKAAMEKRVKEIREQYDHAVARAKGTAA